MKNFLSCYMMFSLLEGKRTFKKTFFHVLRMAKDFKFEAELPGWQRWLIAFVMIVVIVIASMVSISTTLGLEVLGMFVMIAGVLLLSLGLVKTNDDLLFLATHPGTKQAQTLITHHASERFMIMLALFLLVLGLLLQIFGTVF